MSRPWIKGGPTKENLLVHYARVDEETGCWMWTRSLRDHGYGQLNYKSKVSKAHRVVYELFNGPIPDGMNVLHKCDVPGCVNPDHLFIGTQRDNVIDCIKKGRFKIGGDYRRFG